MLIAGDVVFFQQHENNIVVIYDLGLKEKAGFYLGQINGDVLEYKWKSYPKNLRGYGQMIITENTLSGSWWYDNFEDKLEHIKYEYLDDHMPEWLAPMDFQKIWFP